MLKFTTLLDIKDAYFTVSQRRPTFIRHEGLIFELKFNLPGQRAGQSLSMTSWPGFLSLTNLESYEAAPALFMEPKCIGVSTHVDDFEVIAEVFRVDRLRRS